MICWWDFQILQTSCIVNHDQFSQCHSLNILRELPGENLVVDLLRFFVSEALYHTVLLYLFCVYMPSRYTGNSGKRYKPVCIACSVGCAQNLTEPGCREASMDRFCNICRQNYSKIPEMCYHRGAVKVPSRFLRKSGAAEPPVRYKGKNSTGSNSGSETPESVALILRNCGSQSPDRQLWGARNNQIYELSPLKLLKRDESHSFLGYSDHYWFTERR